MRHYISYTLLITVVFVLFSCNSQYLSVHSNGLNFNVTDSIGSDSELVSIYLPYKNVLEKDMSRVISFSEIEMVKDKPESHLTNFLADLLLEQAKKEANKKNLAEPSVSYFNYGGIRTSIPKGEIKVGKIFELMPFENEMVFVKLSGKQVKEFMDNVASKGGDSLGGIRFLITNGKAENVFVGGKPLDLNSYYWIVTNDYTANGGDGLQIFTQRSDYVNTSRKIRDVIINHLEEKQKKGEKIKGNLDGRIAVK